MILFLFFQISLKFSICLNWNNVCLAVMITNCLLLYQADPDVLKMDYVKMIMDFFHKKIVSMLRISIFFKVDPPYISSRFFPWPLEIIFFCIESTGNPRFDLNFWHTPYPLWTSYDFYSASWNFLLMSLTSEKKAIVVLFCLAHIKGWCNSKKEV